MSAPTIQLKPPVTPASETATTEQKYTLEKNNNKYGKALCNIGALCGVGACACLIAPNNQFFRDAKKSLGLFGAGCYACGKLTKLNVTDKDTTNDLVSPMTTQEEPVTKNTKNTKNTKKTNKKKSLIIKSALISTVACIPLLKKKLAKNK
jgi:hypothetical protein